ncbi:MAG: M24 family metallopeptidase [Anaerolineales bacterium]
METRISIQPGEFSERIAKLQGKIHEDNLSGVVLFDHYYILYFSGFAFVPTERPIAFVLSADGQSALFVPRLEVEHAKSLSAIQRVDHYLEYPYHPHPMEVLKDMLIEMGIKGDIGVDQDGYPWILGYRGPELSVMMASKIHKITGFVEDLMMIKSEAEIGLIRESVKWGHLAHVLLQRYTRVGATETEVSQRASQEANLIMLDTIGAIYRAQSPFSEGAGAGYRGQIGRNAAIPHSLANNIVFQEGDVLVTGAGAPVWGYNSELERTMIIGNPSDDQKKMFDHMVALQDTAINVLRPGAKCAEVDRAVRDYYEKHDLMPYWKHHVGHAIGLRYHEAPFLDLGDETEIRPGMVFTVEPGLYHPGLGGFRHSDTVLITEEGNEILTYYPRDLASLTLPA